MKKMTNKKEELAEIKTRVFKYLARREHSRYELYNKLSRKEYNRSNINKVLDELEEKDYINDERFARSWIRSRLRLKPRGARLIKKELAQKGVARSLQDRLIFELISEEKELEMAKELSKKWLSKKKKKENLDRKLYRYLSNKGFSNNICINVIDDFKEKKLL
ncbi:MAG: regulatory protein RecX [Bacillota bacterium]